MNSGLVTLRRLKNDIKDYELLTKWYQKEEIYTHFEQRKLSLDEIKKKYYPRTLDNAKVPVYMIEYQNKPVGIIQYQLIDDDNKNLYGITNDNCYEIDIFIGEISLHNLGIGKTVIDLISDYLFKEKNASLLVMCPLEDNINAIKCYSKCGFKIIREFETENTIGIIKKYVLMIKKLNKKGR